MFDILELCAEKHLETSGKSFKRAAVQHELEQCDFFYRILAHNSFRKGGYFCGFFPRTDPKALRFSPSASRTEWSIQSVCVFDCSPNFIYHNFPEQFCL